MDNDGKHISSEFFEEELNKLISDVKQSKLIDEDLSVSKVNENVLEKRINKETANALLTEKNIDDLLKNERFKGLAQKRIQKDQLLKIVKGGIYLQIIFLNLLIFLVIANKTVNCKLMLQMETSDLALIIDLLKFYVGATVAELLGMMAYIIKKVFDEK